MFVEKVFRGVLLFCRTEKQMVLHGIGGSKFLFAIYPRGKCVTPNRRKGMSSEMRNLFCGVSMEMVLHKCTLSGKLDHMDLISFVKRNLWVVSFVLNPNFILSWNLTYLSKLVLMSRMYFSFFPLICCVAFSSMMQSKSYHCL